MRYWDTSALVPLFLTETGSVQVRQLSQEDKRVTTWVWTRTELVSAIERRAREGSLSQADRLNMLDWIGSVSAGWDEVSDISAVSAQANQLLARHSLRAADAGHLAAAMIVREKINDPLDFVCLDNRLSSAAKQEGFHVLPETAQSS